MSASAGRVLLIPKGEYNSQTTYTMLDMVYYGGKSYVCKQTSTGNLPTNTVYWQIMLDGASTFSELTDVDLNNLQDGDGIYWDGTAQKWKNTTPTSIAVTSPPAKIDYTAGEILDLTGIVVTAYYAGGSTRNVTSECTFSPANGTTLTTSTTSVTVSWRTFSATQTITVAEPIYGVEWDGTSTTAWTRTDMSADFVDPVPYYYGMNDNPSSPFDNIMPWSGMVRVTDSNVGELVAIPKFYYKLSQPTPGTGLKIQISPNAVDGFHVSPAHMDRGDGQGERDVVYVGRYHCDSSTYKSVSGNTPKNDMDRATFRTAIHNLGSNIWMCDFATRFTIWLLYLVEFADWNSQNKIGYGCGNNSSPQAMGYTDSMPYHTGTTQSSRTTYGCGTQYRHIEGLWDNVKDYIDGGYNNSSGMFLILNPSSFSNTLGGISIGIPADGYPSAFIVKDVNGTFPTFIPSVANGSNATYSCDYWNYTAFGNSFYAGGSFYQDQDDGLFQMNCDSSYRAYIGSRLMKLPNAS